MLSGASFVDCFCLEWQLVAFAVNDARIGKVVAVVGKLQGSRAGERFYIGLVVLRTLRQKLGAAGEAIRTVRKVGYKLSMEGSDD